MLRGGGAYGTPKEAACAGFIQAHPDEKIRSSAAGGDAHGACAEVPQAAF